MKIIQSLLHYLVDCCYGPFSAIQTFLCPTYLTAMLSSVPLTCFCMENELHWRSLGVILGIRWIIYGATRQLVNCVCVCVFKCCSFFTEFVQSEWSVCVCTQPVSQQHFSQTVRTMCPIRALWLLKRADEDAERGVKSSVQLKWGRLQWVKTQPNYLCLFIWSSFCPEDARITGWDVRWRGCVCILKEPWPLLIWWWHDEEWRLKQQEFVEGGWRGGVGKVPEDVFCHAY